MKLSVAPESTRTFRSAFVCAVCKRVGILNDLYLHANTLLIPSARAQTDGGTLFKNPVPPVPLFQHSWLAEGVRSYLLPSSFVLDE